MKTTALFIPLLTAAYASAHGYVATLTIAGKDYKGDVPNGPKDPSVIRQVADVSPVKGADNPDVNCGLKATPASLVADANPGDTVSFDWRGGDNSHWPHNTGPMLTYMASCGDQTCDKFDSTKAKWFKVQQVGRDSSGDWAQAKLMAGGVATMTLPSNIAPGNYLIRHEIIALHLATSKGGAEFYPSCSQLKVGGSGTGTPKPDELVSLPGAYSDSDPGIFDPTVYDPGSKYTFPGPPIASFVGSGGDSGDSGDSDNGGDSGSGSGSGGSSTATSSSPRPTNKGSNNGSDAPSKCKLKKTSKSSDNDKRSLLARGTKDNSTTGSSLNVKYYPRHISRVMRNIAFGSHVTRKENGGSW